LLLARIETYLAYENQEGYDLISINAKKNLSAKIQVKSKNFKGDSSFYLNKDDKTKSDFYVFAQTNSMTRDYKIISDSESRPNLYVLDLKTVMKYRKIDKKGTPYLLLSSLPNREEYNRVETNGALKRRNYGYGNVSSNRNNRICICNSRTSCKN
jgi:hypothetical protein